MEGKIFPLDYFYLITLINAKNISNLKKKDKYYQIVNERIQG